MVILFYISGRQLLQRVHKDGMTTMQNLIKDMPKVAKVKLVRPLSFRI